VASVTFSHFLCSVNHFPNNLLATERLKSLILINMSSPRFIGSPSLCGLCHEGLTEPFPFTMAFQPIVDVIASKVFAYEALVRGPKNEPAGFVLGQVDATNRYAFDQNCRIKAITMAANLGVGTTDAKLSLNFMPDVIYNPSTCLRHTLDTARSCNFPLDGLIFELTEDQRVQDKEHLNGIVNEYRSHGFQMAIDDFGAGYAGLNLLASFSADIIKLDMDLIRDLEQRPVAYAIVNSIVQLCNSLGMKVVAEGVETHEEYLALRQCDVKLMQGYLFAKPMFEGLPSVSFPPPSLESMEKQKLLQ
jgi:EAL domain-containing protein (putative c-di-GMP-specific phosphodiesterase class I)